MFLILLLFGSVSQDIVIEFLEIFIYFFLQFGITYLDWYAVGLHKRNAFGLDSYLVQNVFERFAEMAILVVDVFV